MRKKTRKISGMFLCLLMVAMVFAVAVPMSISAGSKEVPFKGNMEGNTVPSGNPAIERIEMSGKATHLGLYTALVEVDMTGLTYLGMDPSGLPIMSIPLTVTFTAANGDELYANALLVGLYHPLLENFPFFNLFGTITGGNGRFDGASGAFTVTGAQISVPGPDNDLIGGTFVGMMSTVGSNK